MLRGLILLAVFISVGRIFYRLARRFKKMGVLFGILGVASYFVGAYGTALTIGLLSAYVDSFDFLDELGYGIFFIIIPTGIITCIAFYQILKRVWSKEKNNVGLDDDLLDADVIRNDNI